MLEVEPARFALVFGQDVGNVGAIGAAVERDVAVAGVVHQHFGARVRLRAAQQDEAGAFFQPFVNRRPRHIEVAQLSWAVGVCRMLIATSLTAESFHERLLCRALPRPRKQRPQSARVSTSSGAGRGWEHLADCGRLVAPPKNTYQKRGSDAGLMALGMRDNMLQESDRKTADGEEQLAAPTAMIYPQSRIGKGKSSGVGCVRRR